MIVCVPVFACLGCVCVVDGCVVGCGFDFVGLLFVCLGVHVHRFMCLCVELGVGSEDCWGLAEPTLT